jgi:hypothetical protein
MHTILQFNSICTKEFDLRYAEEYPEERGVKMESRREREKNRRPFPGTMRGAVRVKREWPYMGRTSNGSFMVC